MSGEPYFFPDPMLTNAIMVEALYPQTGGNFTLRLRRTPPSGPSPDTCGGLPDMLSLYPTPNTPVVFYGSLILTGSHYNGYDYAGPGGEQCDFTSFEDAAYRFSMGANSTLRVATESPAGFAPVMYILDDCPDTAPGAIQCVAKSAASTADPYRNELSYTNPGAARDVYLIVDRYFEYDFTMEFLYTP